MSPPGTDTIFACATAPGRAAIAVVRISGPRADAALEALGAPVPPARQLRLVGLREIGGEAPLDSAFVARFPGPGSYSGEDMVELHLHGGRAVVGAVLAELARIPGLRPAEPGEFTRRAFQNGKFDLTEAEAVADLIDAETAAQRQQALRQLSGQFGRLCDDWRERLLRALAHLEAFIDFPDEELPKGVCDLVEGSVNTLIDEIDGSLADNHAGERLRDGLMIAIVGPPNVGKSSLLNALARRDVAITAETAGTTRDVIEVHFDLDGYPVTLADTAGLRAAADDVEAEGVRRALVQAVAADLRLVVLDASTPFPLPAVLPPILDANTIVVANKIDLLPAAIAAPALELRDDLRPMPLSVRTGQGMAALLERLRTEIAARLPPAEGTPVITRARHRLALEECVAHLRSYSSEKPLELAAEDLRLATRALGRITGRVGVEDLLDVIFRDFCIGK